MTSSDEFRAIKCPNCGAPMTVVGERETCNFCSAIIERAKPDEPEHDELPAVQRVQVTIGSTTSRAPRRIHPIYRVINCLLIVVMAIFGLAIVGLVVYLVQSGEVAQMAQRIQYTAGSNGVYGDPTLLSIEAGPGPMR